MLKLVITDQYSSGFIIICILEVTIILKYNPNISLKY